MLSHDKKAHNGLALSQTGYVDGCERCSMLMSEDAEKQRIQMLLSEPEIRELVRASEFALSNFDGTGWIEKLEDALEPFKKEGSDE